MTWVQRRPFSDTTLPTRRLLLRAAPRAYANVHRSLAVVRVLNARVQVYPREEDVAEEPPRTRARKTSTKASHSVPSLARALLRDVPSAPSARLSFSPPPSLPPFLFLFSTLSSFTPFSSRSSGAHIPREGRDGGGLEDTRRKAREVGGRGDGRVEAAPADTAVMILF